jgi:hypothetical protein
MADWGEWVWGRGRYQFAAMIGFPRGLTLLDFGFSLIFGMEDLFFFFWSSRPIVAGLDDYCGVEVRFPTPDMKVSKFHF